MDFFDDVTTQAVPSEAPQVDQSQIQQAQYDVFSAFSNEAPVQSQQQSVVYVSPEQQIRKDKLKIIEEERLAQIREKDQQERLLKQQKKQKGQEYLQQFKSQLETDIQQRKVLNKQKQEIWLENKKNHSQYKNSWDQIASNIALKDGEYPGQKDVTKMRQAILNKRIDLTK
ncbi:unnamed protein product [Paramecium pentaurelia]|uniref:Clathrin light chain n=1 Tax=Paramecium pentaurelia TaxID=43138 RepID=A0A8S1VDG9_9CILI|nr:unnamed protein product [Paramecium pentaurelia]